MKSTPGQRWQVLLGALFVLTDRGIRQLRNGLQDQREYLVKRKCDVQMHLYNLETIRLDALDLEKEVLAARQFKFIFLAELKVLLEETIKECQQIPLKSGKMLNYLCQRYLLDIAKLKAPATATDVPAAVEIPSIRARRGETLSISQKAGKASYPAGYVPVRDTSGLDVAQEQNLSDPQDLCKIG
jgi:hypothetical protein